MQGAQESGEAAGGAGADSGWVIRVADRQHRGDQVHLFEESFGQGQGAPILRWRYEECPHGEPICLLGYAQGRAVSGYACNPRRIGWEGDGVTIGQTGDVMTHPEARGQGHFSSLDRAAMEASKSRGWPVVFGLPNRQSAGIFLERLGWKGVAHLQPWTFVLRADQVARSERLRAGRLAKALVPWALWRGGVVRAGLVRQAAGTTVERVERFDRWVEPIAQKVSEDYLWMVRRDVAYLNWRFFESPNARFTVYRVRRDGADVGYAVTQDPEGDGVGYLVDLVAIDGGARAAGMEAGLQGLFEAGASVVRAHAIRGSDWMHQLDAAGFRGPKAQDEKWVIVYVHDPEHPLGSAAGDPTQWFFTDADRDDELVR